MRSIMSALIVLAMVFTMISVSEASAPYSCIASPAYVDYSDARAIPCPVEGTPVTPDAMGSPGF